MRVRLPTELGAETHCDLTSGHLERRYGISSRTLRYYEEQGLLTPKCIGDLRLFSPKDVIRLELVLKGRKLGLALNEVHCLIRSHEVEPKAALPSKRASDDFATMQQRLSLLEAQKASLEAAIGELKARLTADNTLVAEE